MGKAVVAARYWNVWWTLSVVFLGLAVLTGALEYLGFFQDLDRVESGLDRMEQILIVLPRE